MFSIYDLKPRFQALLRPIVLRFYNAGVTANQVTLGALLLSVLVGLLISLALVSSGGDAGWYLLFYPPVLFLRMALNAIDGMLAREFGQKSNLGALLNEICDLASDAALYLPFGLIRGIPGPLVVIFVIGAALTEMAGMAGLQFGAARRYDGPMGKSDRALLISLLGIALGCGLIGPFAAELLFVAALILILLTIRNRTRSALASARGPSVQSDPADQFAKPYRSEAAAPDKAELAD